MKIGVSSYSFSQYMKHTGCSYFRICDEAKRIGFSGIEFINLNWKGVAETDDEKALAREIRAYCEKIGLEIIAYTVGANLLAEDGDAEIENVKYCLDVAKELGAPLLRHDLTFRMPDRRGYTWRDALPVIVPRVREITRYAAQLGIRTCSENHGQIFQDADRVESVIREVGDENYGWLVDMGNFICTDGDILRSVRTAAPYAFHVHAKDFLWKPCTEPRPEGWGGSAGGNHWRGTVLGHGVIPVRACVDILRNAGYDGWFSLEFEGWEENVKALESGFAYLRDTAAQGEKS